MSEEMTDKQIIIDVCPYRGECSVSGCKRNDDGCFVRQLFEERYRAENQIVELNKKVEAKEQECEELKRKVNDKHNLLMQYVDNYDQLKGVIKKYEECNKYLVEENGKTYTRLEYKLLKTLEEIKPILEFYANSKIGEQQEDGSYKILLNGGYIPIYDPKPAREALRKINEVEDEN